ncbi:hypothetical protein FCULG_00008204 [Fusarium culmorum]|uniref:Uncharacterized protein n=1 Tax=Fusarium culmorum TaxID=5516 RepID=A0A2T4H136_FUSCU|nr:hypothetical protein FCULG_00008204 [Fusarium culmorum]
MYIVPWKAIENAPWLLPLKCSGSSARYHNGWVLTEWKHNGWIYSGQAIQPALAQFQRQQTTDVVLSPGPKRYSYRLSSGVVALSSALSTWFLATKSRNLSSHLAPLFLMHILLPTVQRRHKHPNTHQDVSAYSPLRYRYCFNEKRPPSVVVIRTALKP